jgi:hypothetical protein
MAGDGLWDGVFVLHRWGEVDAPDPSGGRLERLKRVVDIVELFGNWRMGAEMVLGEG